MFAFIVFLIFLDMNMIASYLMTGSFMFEGSVRWLKIIGFSLPAALISTLFEFGLNSNLSFIVVYFLATAIIFDWDFKTSAKFTAVVSFVEAIVFLLFFHLV